MARASRYNPGDCDDEGCGTHHRVDVRYVDPESDTVCLVSYRGAYCVYTEDDPWWDERARSAMVTGAAIPPPFNTMVMHVGDRAIQGALDALTEGGALTRWIAGHDDIDIIEEHHDMVVSMLPFLDLSTVVDPSNIYDEPVD